MVHRRISGRAQVRAHITHWVGAHPDQVSVALTHDSLRVSTFDGSAHQMRQAVQRELVARGWVSCVIQGVKTCIQVSA